MIGIVGGGVSGLFLLHFLADLGADAILFEASPTPGGVMRSVSIDGPRGPVVADLGPQRMRLTSRIASVASSTGLTHRIVQAPGGIPFTVLHRGRLHPAPLSLGDAVLSSLVSMPGKLRALGDLVTGPPRPDETVAEALDRKLGPEISTRLAGPLLGGLYGSEPEEMEARHTLLPALERAGGGRSLLRALLRASKWERLPVVSFDAGMGALPLALADAHRDRVRLSSPVEGIERRPGGGWDVTLGAGAPGGAERIPVGDLVLTLPAPDAARIVETFDRSLAVKLGALRYNPLAVVPMVAEESSALGNVGTGFKVTSEDDFATRGVTAHEALFRRPGLFTAFLGGMGKEAVVDLPDDRLLETARSDFRSITGGDATPLLAHRTRMPAWDRSWRAMDGLELPPGLHLCAAYTDRPGVAGRLESASRAAERLTAR